MNVTTTDREQRELFQRWWKNQGKWLLLAVALGVLLGLGWQRWQQYQRNRTLAASTIYQSLQHAEAQHQTQVIGAYREQLRTRYPSTPYASFSQFAVAKEAVSQKAYPKAIAALKWVIIHTKEPTLKQVARLRVARIEIQQKHYDDALTVLSTRDSPAYQPMIDQVRAAIYSAQGQSKQAKAAYQAAQKGYAALGVHNPLVDMAIAL